MKEQYPGQGWTQRHDGAGAAARPSPHAGDKSALSALPTGTSLQGAKFQIEGLLHDQSQFSFVYRCLQLGSLRRPVVIKEYFPRDFVVRGPNATVSVDTKAHQEVFQRSCDSFLSEGQRIVDIHHPNVVKAYEAFKEKGTAYLVMELIDGVPLSRWLDAASIDEAALLRTLNGLLDALQAIHAVPSPDGAVTKYLIHRDLKPDNIMMRKDGTPVIIDFGAARFTVGTHTQDLTKVFTPGFSPPEQTSNLPGNRQGPYTDLYALGATMYAWLTGSTPVDANDRMRIMIMNQLDPLQPLSERLAARKFDVRILSTIDRCLELDSRKRPQSVDEVRSLLTQPQSAGSEENAGPRGWLRRLVMWVGGGILVLVMLFFLRLLI